LTPVGVAGQPYLDRPSRAADAEDRPGAVPERYDVLAFAA
jgi:hypothetical protein